MTTQAPRSCLVYGPSGCSKTTNAQAIAEVLSDQAWRERIGNAVTPAAAETVADVMGITLLLVAQGERLAPPCPISDAEHSAVAWLGQAGLYRTRFDAVRNFEQSITPVSVGELFNLASKHVLSQINEGSLHG